MKKNPNPDREYKAQLEHSFLMHIGYEYVEVLCSGLDEVKEEWENVKVPESLDRWMNDFTAQERRMKKKRKYGFLANRFVRKAAVIILFLLVFNNILMASVDAYRLRLLESISYIQESFTQINFDLRSPGYKSSIPMNWDGWFYLTYIPKGYSLYDDNITEQSAMLDFKNAGDGRIILQQVSCASSQQLDTENSTITKIIVNEEEALLIEKDDFKIISWLQDDIALYLQGNNINVRELKKVAENIKRDEK
ncbi:MAG: hypothetical protein K0S76_2237 [Herbinix sp.]|jgi:hypothetical protein|nr:hypothetical protein [Herbinix sp.]